MNSHINERTSRYASVIRPYDSRMPDIEHNASYYAGNSSEFAGYVSRNHVALRNYGIPCSVAPNSKNRMTLTNLSVIL